MLSIGAFAQIGQVTHRMLRHWDTAGLLEPAHVDEFSGYRSYDPSQLDRLHRIVALRQLGFGLDDISAILERGVDAERIAALLRIRRAEVEQEHRVAAERLVDVERRLHLIERENLMSRIEIIELPAADEAVCGIHLGSMDRISESWHAIHTEIFARGLVHDGPCRELYVRAVAEDQSDWVTELQQPVRRG